MLHRHLFGGVDLLYTGYGILDPAFQTVGAFYRLIRFRTAQAGTEQCSHTVTDQSDFMRSIRRLMIFHPKHSLVRGITSCRSLSFHKLKTKQAVLTLSRKEKRKQKHRFFVGVNEKPPI